VRLGGIKSTVNESKRAVGRGWDVVSVVVECHITELVGVEVDLRDNPGVGV